VRLEASTKPPIHNLIHEFLINMVFTMAYPNFKKGVKMAFGPLGVKLYFWLQRFGLVGNGVVKDIGKAEEGVKDSK
jgi:hypothetical protein